MVLKSRTPLCRGSHRLCCHGMGGPGCPTGLAGRESLGKRAVWCEELTHTRPQTPVQKYHSLAPSIGSYTYYRGHLDHTPTAKLLERGSLPLSRLLPSCFGQFGAPSQIDLHRPLGVHVWQVCRCPCTRPMPSRRPLLLPQNLRCAPRKAIALSVPSHSQTSAR
jgi:hypothetical protein